MLISRDSHRRLTPFRVAALAGVSCDAALYDSFGYVCLWPRTSSVLLFTPAVTFHLVQSVTCDLLSTVPRGFGLVYHLQRGGMGCYKYDRG